MTETQQGQDEMSTTRIGRIKGWQERLIEEQKELEGKILRLSRFIMSKDFKNLDDEQRELLFIQRHVMQQYSRVLADRVALFLI